MSYDLLLDLVYFLSLRRGVRRDTECRKFDMGYVKITAFHNTPYQTITMYYERFLSLLFNYFPRESHYLPGFHIDVKGQGIIKLLEDIFF